MPPRSDALAGLPMNATEPPPVSLALAIQALSSEVQALRQDVRDLRTTIAGLDDELTAMREKASAKHEQLVILRTQFRVMWAVAAIAGASGLGALVLELLRVIQHP